MAKARTSRWLLGLIVAVSLYAAAGGYGALSNWSLFGFGTKVYFGALLVLGALSGAAALWWLIRGANVWLRRAVVVCLAGLALNQAAGLALGTAPCSTPG